MSKFSKNCAAINDLLSSNNESDYNLGLDINQKIKDFILDEMKAYGINTKNSVGNFNGAGVGFILNQFSDKNISFKLSFSLDESGNIIDSKISFSGVSYKTDNLDGMLYIVDDLSETVDNCIAITQDVVEFIANYNI